MMAVLLVSGGCRNAGPSTRSEAEPAPMPAAPAAPATPVEAPSAQTGVQAALLPLRERASAEEPEETGADDPAPVRASPPPKPAADFRSSPAFKRLKGAIERANAAVERRRPRAQPRETSAE